MTDPTQATYEPGLQVPLDFPLTLNVNMSEARLIGSLLDERPHREVAPLIMRLNAQVAQQAHAAFGPKPPPAAAVGQMLLSGGDQPDLVYLPKEEKVWGNSAHAAQDIAAAELERKEIAGRLPTSQLSEETPDQDYATSLLYVQLALQHLDESVPNGQIQRTLRSFAAMKHGVALFEAWLHRREYGVQP